MSLQQKANLGLTATAQSFGFFKSHKGLVIFPIASFLASLAFIALFAGLVFEVSMYTNVLGLGTELGQILDSEQPSSGTETASTRLLSIAGFVALFILSACLHFVSTFFNVALSACVLAIFEGKPIGVGGGVLTATLRLRAIFGWSIVTASIGIVMNMFDRRGNIFASILTFLAGLAWRVATLFVIPIIASKQVGPISAIKESVRLMRADWGTAGNSGHGSRKARFIVILLAVGVILLTHLNLGDRASTDIAFFLFPFLVIFLLFFSTIYTITCTALFYYAKQHAAPPQFDSDTLRSTIAFRQSRL